MTHLSCGRGRSARWWLGLARGFPPMSLRVVVVASLLLASTAHAQDASLKGKFQDGTTRSPISGVQLKLTNFADSADVHRATAGDNGAFQIEGLGVHSYRLEATRLGYAPLTIVIRVTQKG